MRQLWLWTALLASRSVDSGVARAVLASEPTTPSGDGLHDLLWRGKVIREAHRRLSEWAAGDGVPAPAVLEPLRERLGTAVGEDDAWRDQAMAPMREALRDAQDHGLAVMKGLALASHYDEPLSRHMGDVDLHSPDWPAVVAFCRRATERGWVWDVTEFPWVKWDKGTLYGQLSLVTPDNRDPVARIDLHVGPYSVGPNGRVYGLGHAEGTALEVPSRLCDPVTLAVILVAHAANDGFLSLKDLNDFAALTAGGDIDAASLAETCRAFGCEPILDQIRGTVAALRTLGGPDGTAALLARATAGPLTLVPPEGRNRALLAGRFAYRLSRLDGDSVLGALRVAGSSYRYYGADLSVRPGKPSARMERRWRRPDVCWRLVPPESWPAPAGADAAGGPTAGEELADGITRHTRGSAVAVTLADHVFVPTVWGEVSPESVGLASELLATESQA
ncbi:nucleotidyltransferase family protein [Streptomyces sp. SP18CS02]|uniref:nucleotidyltransferase family protein n=1 Tax=Streptomyces sp. SP18CS02 TaxID=3002531 RepID=UPI002E78C77F|nr:nucleotidyltransferase family protein [Streptomyces sp. SP18CS02]MEE1752753.1 nucleotidyltransferase family protein [Streptomyces sp. SP18CS02]